MQGTAPITADAGCRTACSSTDAPVQRRHSAVHCTEIAARKPKFPPAAPKRSRRVREREAASRARSRTTLSLSSGSSSRGTTAGGARHRSLFGVHSHVTCGASHSAHPGSLPTRLRRALMRPWPAGKRPSADRAMRPPPCIGAGMRACGRATRGDAGHTTCALASAGEGPAIHLDAAAARTQQDGALQSPRSGVGPALCSAARQHEMG
jgi:hypothetical protein